MTARAGQAEAIAQAAARTLPEGEALPFGATIRMRLDAATPTAPTADATLPADAAAGPMTVDPRTLPPLAIAEPGAGADPSTDFVLGAALGEGGMGVVLLARQRSLQRDVALKRLRPEGTSVHHAQALLREAVFTGYLEHPGIVPVHALGRDAEGHPLLVMKRIEGTTLAALLRDPEHPGWAQADGDRLGLLVRALRGVCNALAFAHARGVLHRDVKPENVMLGPFGEVYLLDWGVAMRRADRPADDSIVGTPAYLAPEMLRAHTDGLDERTDVYLVGATLHECLVGKPPHEGSNIYQVLLSATLSEPREYPTETPTELADIARRAMHVDRAQRFPSAEALGTALADFERHRAAAELAAAASARLADLEAAIARKDEPVTVERLFHECRFGFEQTLRAWPDNERVRAELRRALVAMCGFLVRQRNRAGAAALLAALDPRPPELVEALAALDRDEAQGTEERARLRRLERAADVNVASRERRIAAALAALALVVLGGVLTAGHLSGAYEPSPEGMLASAIPTVGVLAALAWIFRKRLFRNRVSRQMGLTVAIVVGCVVANRALGVALHQSFADVATSDSLIIAVTAALGSLTLRRIYLVPAVLSFAAAVASPFVGDLAFVPLVGAGAISVIVIVLAPERLRGPLLREDDASDGPDPRT